ncbi:MAG: S16 family serine protease [Myxococcota bacterium]
MAWPGRREAARCSRSRPTSHGRGLVLTGQLGDVMKESGQAALSFVRSILESDRRRRTHLHAPPGPRARAGRCDAQDDSPAGVAIATAIASLASGIPVRADVAMTGEVTLRGRVLPVGGVREKALAALRSGITTIVIPESNVSDLREIPKDLKKRLTFLPVGHMREVLDQVLVEPLEWRAKECAKKARPGVPRTTTPMHAADCEPGESI